MKNFHGKLQSHVSGVAERVTVGVDDTWIRIWNDHKRIGAWNVEDVPCERITVFRFNLDLDGVPHTFTPDDPAAFAESIRAVVDLRPTSRFGLGDRVRAAKAAMAAAGSESDTPSA